MKTIIIPLVFGVFIAGIAFSTANFVSNDMRLIYLLPAVLLFAAGLWLGSRGLGGWAAWPNLCLPLIIAFAALAGRRFEMVIWVQCVLWSLCALFGLLWNHKGRMRVAVQSSICLMAVLSLVYTFVYLPRLIAYDENRYRRDPAPQFSLQLPAGGSLSTASFKGKTVVLDWFSTTCVPCLRELPEIEQAQKEMSGRDDVAFFLVVSDVGGDTLESTRAFLDQRGSRLPVAFDGGGKAHDAFGFQGVPAMVVLDKSGNIRLSREGFNSAEKNFRADLVRLISNL